VGYTSGAEAAGRVGVGAGEDGGGSGSGAAGAAAVVEGRHWDWGRRLQQEKGLPGHSHKQVHTFREAPYHRAAGIARAVIGQTGRAIRVSRETSIRWVSGRCVVVGIGMGKRGVVKGSDRQDVGGRGGWELGGWEAGVQRVAASGAGAGASAGKAWLGLALTLVTGQWAEKGGPSEACNS
jgi:hypothetical protein